MQIYLERDGDNDKIFVSSFFAIEFAAKQRKEWGGGHRKSYIFIFSIGFQIHSLQLKDCFPCFTEEIKAVFKGKRTAGEWH